MQAEKEEKSIEICDKESQTDNQFQCNCREMMEKIKQLEKKVEQIHKEIHLNTKYGSNKNIALINAVKNGDRRAVKFLCEKNANVNSRTTRNETALGLAAKANYYEIAKILCEYNANKKNKNFALIHFSAHGNTDAVEFLCKSGADVNATIHWQSTFPWNTTALMVAALKGHLEVVQILCASEASQENKNAALIRASEGGHVKVIELLFSNGADSNARIIDEKEEPYIITSAESRSALVTAAENGHGNAVKFLCEHHAYGATQEDKGKALCNAIMDSKHSKNNNNFTAIKYLVEDGVRIPYNYERYTPRKLTLALSRFIKQKKQKRKKVKPNTTMDRLKNLFGTSKKKIESSKKKKNGYEQID